MDSSCLEWTLRHVHATISQVDHPCVYICIYLSLLPPPLTDVYPYSAVVPPARLSFSRQLRCKNVIKGVRASAHIMKVDGDRRHGRAAASEWRPKATAVQRVCSRALHARTRARINVAMCASIRGSFLLTERIMCRDALLPSLIITNRSTEALAVRRCTGCGITIRIVH